MSSADPSNELDALLRRLPAGRSVGLADPASAPEPGEIVLALPGPDLELTGPTARRLVAAASRAGAAALVLPAGIDPADTDSADADPAGTVPAGGRLVVDHKPDSVSWRQLHTALAARIDRSRPAAGDELADLAQTIATLTGGLVTIEDTAARVLAYSRSSDEVDELRRLSILGRSGPADYLALLREWGVYDRLATPDEVVEIAEHPASGVRRRLAVGVFAGDRQLGTIWVQQGSTGFGPNAGLALLGAARLTADLLAGRGAAGTPPANRLADLLAGRVGPAALGLGRDAGRPCAVAAVLPSAAEDGAADRTQRLAELAAIVNVQAVAFRRHALVDVVGGRLLVLLPGLGRSEPGGATPAQPDPGRTSPGRPDSGPDEPPAAVAMLEQAVAAIRRHLDPAARAVLGPVVRSPAQAADSARGAELVASVQTAEPVLSFGRARNRLIIQAVLKFLDGQPELLDPRVAELISDDPVSAHTLLRYLDTGSQIGRVADELAVHPTTVRYRLRRVSAALGLELADPAARLAIQLQLCRGLRTRPGAG